MSKAKVQDFYDVVWTRYLPEYDATEKHWEHFYSAAEVAGKRVLDAGCGTGIFSSIFARNGAAGVTGIDISPGSLGTARGLKEQFDLEVLELEEQDMLHLPYPDASFDIVWAWGTVHHTTDPLAAIRELIRVLKPGGSIMLAIYKRTNVTWIHEAVRRILYRTPRRSWAALAKVLAFSLAPVVHLFKRREKMRGGETLEELILDWYFVPIRYYFRPEEIRRVLENEGFTVEKFVPAAGRFDSSSNFMFKARKAA